jgi:isovaleryl-CoA dehydrogenase
MVQREIADMAVEIDAARLLTRHTAWMMDEDEPATRAASYSKYAASGAARHAAQATAEIFGGYALADDYPVSYYTAYINMLNVGEGAPNVQRILIAEDALGYKNADRHRIRRFGPATARNGGSGSSQTV